MKSLGVNWKSFGFLICKFQENWSIFKRLRAFFSSQKRFGSPGTLHVEGNLLSLGRWISSWRLECRDKVIYRGVAEVNDESRDIPVSNLISTSRMIITNISRHFQKRLHSTKAFSHKILSCNEILTWIVKCDGRVDKASDTDSNGLAACGFES